MNNHYDKIAYLQGHQAYEAGEPLDTTQTYWWQFGWKEASHAHLQDKNAGGPNAEPGE